MMGWSKLLFAPSDFMPHGFCYLWNSRLVWLHIISDSLIALSYFAIPILLLIFVRKRRDVPFTWMFVLFGVFIIACGATHAMEIWNLWHGNYWLSGGIKSITAAASVSTAVLLARLMPRAVHLPSLSQWQQANTHLETEVRYRRDLELELRVREASYREQAELLDLAYDAILVRTIEGKILFWNRGAERLYGWQKEEAVRRVIYELLRTKLPTPLPEIVAEVLEKGSWEGELSHERRDGARITVLSRWVLRDDPGGKTSILEINRDITERKKEERRFRGLLESAPDAMVIVTRAGRIQLVNAQTEKLFGYSRNELIGQPVEILMPEKFQSGHVAHRHRYSESPRPREMGAGLELYGRRKDGSEFPVEISLSPLETEEGSLFASAIRDITDRKRAELKFRNLLESAPDAIVIVNQQGQIQLVNVQAETLFGYSRAELVGQPVEILIPQRFREGHVANRQGCAETPRSRAMGAGLELYGRRKDGTEFPVEISLSPIETDEGVLISSAIRDVTDRRNADEQIRSLNSELERGINELEHINRELETFSYSVSHDLRAPLRHIDGFARILKEDHGHEFSAEAHQHLDRILHAASHMGDLVDNLLNLARIGRKELVRKKVSLGSLLSEAISDLAVDESRHVEWQIQTLPEVECDPGLLKVVFSNLLSNALKFTRDQPSPVIQVGASVEDGKLTFFVRDNGVGFDPKYADKLFGVFQRLHTQDQFEGTGVGLATVQRIVHRHEGRIWAQSELGSGATFFFTLNGGSTLKLHSKREAKGGTI